MLIRYLPLILAAPAALLALAPLDAAAQELGPGIRTEMTPLDRQAHNGVFDRKPKSAASARLKPSVSVGEVRPVEELRAEDAAARYVTQARPYSTDPPPRTGVYGSDPTGRKPGPGLSSGSGQKDRLGSEPRSVEEREHPGG